MSLAEVLRNLSPVNEDELDDIDLPSFLLRACGKVHSPAENDNWNYLVAKGRPSPRDEKPGKWRFKEPEYRKWRKNVIDER